MGELVIVVCLADKGRCDGFGPAAPEREDAVRARFAEARALLEPAGLWATEPVVALDAGLGGVLATTFQDAAREGLAAYPGRPVLFFGREVGLVPDLDVVLHELTHVWLRAAGAQDARWRLEAQPRRAAGAPRSRQASHESALVHEGLADFVAAALTGDPILGEGHGGVMSLRVAVLCPDGLVGAPHTDAAVVSGALWELGGAGQNPTAMAEVLAAVRASVAAGSSSVSALVDAVGASLSGRADGLAARWAELVAQRGLSRCGEPIAVRATRVSARAGEFVAAGTGRFSAVEAVDVVGGPLSFSARVDGPSDRAMTAKITARSSEPHALAVDWRALGAGGAVMGEGRAPLQGWPSQWASVAVPRGSHTLDFVFTTTTSGDVAYNDVQVSWTAMTIEATSLKPAPPSGCFVGVPSIDLVIGLMAAVGVAWFARATRRDRRSS